ncbi:MAG: hypothetical protein JSS07_03285 [Proteobacteria bacterium]|nr:hypothetical protein [Pseudomonadota bacterium]
MKPQAVSSTYKGSDKEGRVRLGQKFSDKQWQVTEFENGCVLLVPMVPATNEEAMATFEKVFAKHKKTMDALK